MKPHTLMLVLMSGALLACQSQQGQLSGERQISSGSAMRFAHDPTGEKELLYLRGLLKLPEQGERSINDTREALWSRQQRKADVMYELISFYGRYPQQPDKAKLTALIRQMDRQLAPNQRIWLWALVRLPDELKTQTTPVELQTLCQQVAANTPTFGYVQPSTLQLCRRAQLLSLRQQAANQTGKRWPVLLADIRADVQSGRLQKSDLLPLMTILQSRRLGDDVMPQQAIELGRLANGQEPAIELAMAGLLLEQLSSKTDSIQLEKRLLQLHQQGEKRAAYLLGRLYIEGRYRVAEPALAEQVLKDATELPEASYLLGRLYLSGLLGGQPNVQAGVDLLVQSARQGYAKADLALAEAFHDTPGVKANPVYAWVFTSLALQQNPDSLQQQRRLATLTLDSQHQQQAEALLRKERQVRIAHTIHSALPLQLVQEAETETPDEVVPDRNDMKKPDTEQKNSEKKSDEKNTEKNTELVSNF